MKLADEMRMNAIEYLKQNKTSTYNQVKCAIESTSAKGELNLAYTDDLSDTDIMLLRDVDGFTVKIRIQQRKEGFVYTPYTVYNISW